MKFISDKDIFFVIPLLILAVCLVLVSVLPLILLPLSVVIGIPALSIRHTQIKREDIRNCNNKLAELETKKRAAEQV